MSIVSVAISIDDRSVRAGKSALLVLPQTISNRQAYMSRTVHLQTRHKGRRQQCVMPSFRFVSLVYLCILCSFAASADVRTLPSAATDVTITHSNLGTLHTYAFAAKQALRTLDLRSNNITRIEPLALFVVDHLQVLYASFDNESNASQTLDLRGNNLGSINSLVGNECENCTALSTVLLTISHLDYVCNHIMDAEALSSDRYATMLEQLRRRVHDENIIEQNPWRCMRLNGKSPYRITQNNNPSAVVTVS